MKRSARLKEEHNAVLTQLEALLAAVEARDVKDFTTEEDTEFSALTAKAEKLKRDFDAALSAEKAVAEREAIPAHTPVERAAPGRVAATVKEQLPADRQVSLLAAGHIKSKQAGDHPLKILSDEGYGRFADELADINYSGKSVNTLTGAAGGVLLPAAARGQLLEMLTPKTTFLLGNPQRVPLVGGRYEQPAALTGATAAYVGESGKKPVSDVTFAMSSMKAKKLAGIVLITKEATKWLVPDIESYIRRNLGIALPQAMDTAAYFGTGSGDTPLGILNVAGVGVIDASTLAVLPKAPTLAEIDTIAGAATLYMATRDMNMGNVFWLMAHRTLEWLKNIRVGGGDGVFAFPELQGAAPRWKGYPVLVTNKVPTNGGTNTDETTIALIDFDEVLFGEEEGLTVSTSSEATIDVGGTLVHLYQQNMMAVLAEMMHDFGLARAAGVVKITKVRWGSTAGA